MTCAMKRTLPALLTLFCLNLLTLPSLYGQSAVGTNGLRAAVDLVKTHFKDAIGEQSALYNGPEYYFYDPKKVHGSPYFMENTVSTGDIMYDGVEFRHVVLFYDLYKDEIVTALPDNISYFSLFPERVQNFDLLNHHFIKINTSGPGIDAGIKSGYYDELYPGRSEVLERITKTVEEITSSTGTLEAFSTFSSATENFFVKKGNVYYPANGEAAALDVFKDKKKLVKNYIRANKIRFRKGVGQALTSIAAYYDSLTN
jgi:hypothetical protein